LAVVDAGLHVLPRVHAAEVVVERLRAREAREFALGQMEQLREAAARTARVDDEARLGAERRALADPREDARLAVTLEGFDEHPVLVLDARRLRLADEEEVEIRAVPVRVGDVVVRARLGEQLVGAVARAGERAPARVAVEAEPALRPDADPR